MKYEIIETSLEKMYQDTMTSLWDINVIDGAMDPELINWGVLKAFTSPERMTEELKGGWTMPMLGSLMDRIRAAGDNYILVIMHQGKIWATIKGADIDY